MTGEAYAAESEAPPPAGAPDRLAPYLPWTDGTGRARGAWWRVPLAARGAVGYLVVSWGLFARLAHDGGAKYVIADDRVGAWVYRIPDLSQNAPRAVRSLLTAPFLNHDSLQLVYVTTLVLLFGVVFEAREGTRTTMLVFFGAGLAAAVGAGLLLHVIYPDRSGGAFFETAWERTWSGGSAGCFGLMGGLAARARRPWPLLGLFALWEINVEYWHLRSYTTVFHFIALGVGFLLMRYGVQGRFRACH